LLRNVNSKSQVADESMSVPVILSDLERQDARSHIFQADLLNNVRIVLPRTTKFGRITVVGRSVFLGSVTPPPQGDWPQRSLILGVLLYLMTYLTDDIKDWTDLSVAECVRTAQDRSAW